MGTQVNRVLLVKRDQILYIFPHHFREREEGNQLDRRKSEINDAGLKEGAKSRIPEFLRKLCLSPSNILERRGREIGAQVPKKPESSRLTGSCRDKCVLNSLYYTVGLQCAVVLLIWPDTSTLLIAKGKSDLRLEPLQSLLGYLHPSQKSQY